MQLKTAAAQSKVFNTSTNNTLSGHLGLSVTPRPQRDERHDLAFE